MDYTTILIFVIIILLITNIIITICWNHSIKKRLSDTQAFLYDMQRRIRMMNSLYDNLLEGVESLSVGFDNTQKTFQIALDNKLSIGRFPMPNEIKDIKMVIDNQIEQVVGLTKGQRIKDRSVYETVIENVCKTFPEINIEYIVREVTSHIELSKTNNE